MNTDDIAKFLKTAGVDLLRGILVLVVGFFIVHWISKLLKHNKKFLAIEPTLRGFLQNLIKIALSVLVILTAVNMMGIPMTSVVTLLASGGVAIGLALQGAVGNLLGGLILLILRPIRAGEYVKIGDSEGTVKTVGAYYTELITVDNKQLCLPNGALTNTTITNFSREGTRRLDLSFSVAYSIAAYACCKTGGFHERGLAEVHCVGIARLRALHDTYAGSVKHKLLRLTDSAVLQLETANARVLEEYISILSTSVESGGEYAMQFLLCERKQFYVRS